MWFLHVNKKSVTFTFIEKKAKFAFVKNIIVFATAKTFSSQHRPHHAWNLYFKNVVFALPTAKFKCDTLNFTFPRGKKFVTHIRGCNAVSVSLVFTTLIFSPSNVRCSRGLPRYNVCMARLQGTEPTRGVETEKCCSAKTTLEYCKSAFDDSSLKRSISFRRQVCTTKFTLEHYELRLCLSCNFL
jgi:hypothetical protein